MGVDSFPEVVWEAGKCCKSTKSRAAAGRPSPHPVEVRHCHSAQLFLSRGPMGRQKSPPLDSQCGPAASVKTPGPCRRSGHTQTAAPARPPRLAWCLKLGSGLQKASTAPSLVGQEQPGGRRRRRQQAVQAFEQHSAVNECQYLVESTRLAWSENGERNSPAAEASAQTRLAQGL